MTFIQLPKYPNRVGRRLIVNKAARAKPKSVRLLSTVRMFCILRMDRQGFLFTKKLRIKWVLPSS